MILQCRNIKKRFGGIIALNSCSINLHSGITSLIGPNGAGKTTLFDIITGFSSPDSGKVWFKKKDITSLSPEKRVRFGIVRTFQLVRIFPDLTVLENLMLAKRQFSEGISFVFLRPWKVKKEQEDIRNRALDILEHLGLSEKANTLASELSFGQQKLLEIARSIILDPQIMLLDEPASGVSPLMKENLKVILRRLSNEGIIIFLIEHDMNFVMDISDSVIVLDQGKEIASGSPDEIKSNKDVIDVYLGGKNVKA